MQQLFCLFLLYLAQTYSFSMILFIYTPDMKQCSINPYFHSAN